MNPETQAKMNELLTWLMDTVKQSGEFVQAQAPDVARQMVAWGFWSGWTGATMCAVGAVAAVIFGLRAGRMAERGWRCDNSHYKTDGQEAAAAVGGILGSILCTVAFILCLIGIPTYWSTALKATVAPKLYVLEQVGQMLK
jgi:hypothetical protein